MSRAGIRMTTLSLSLSFLCLSLYGGYVSLLRLSLYISEPTPLDSFRFRRSKRLKEREGVIVGASGAARVCVGVMEQTAGGGHYCICCCFFATTATDHHHCTTTRACTRLVRPTASASAGSISTHPQNQEANPYRIE